jgi:two-component system C4-dicarboxylate transport sensor histidine kinase DctB
MATPDDHDMGREKGLAVKSIYPQGATHDDRIVMAMGHICSQVAHDMHSSLTCIKAGAAVLNDPGLPAETKSTLLNVVLKSADKLIQMAEELLDYRRATHITLRPIHLTHLISTACSELELLATIHNVVIHHHVDVPEPVWGDAEKLSRVLQNLLQNAIDALRHRSDGQIWVTATVEDGQVQVIVQDNGPGVPELHRSKLFNQGFTTKGRRGNGLGLLYCRAVVEGHGGQISSRTHPEDGTQFKIQFPILPASQEGVKKLA